MIKLTWPQPSFKVKKDGQRDMIFDACRKKWVLLTPEEWVRQNFLQYLVEQKKYPNKLIAVEREIVVADTKKRFDIVVFKNSAPWMIVECKEMEVELTEAVIQQILNYNIALQAKFLVITNGRSTFAININEGRFEWLTTLPDY